MLTERKNIVNFLKIIAKEVIECSMVHGGVLESENLPLQVSWSEDPRRILGFRDH